MPSVRHRTITYLRAAWLNSPGLTLEEALRRTLAQLPNVEDTKLPLRAGLAEVRHRAVPRNSVQLHVAGWTAQEAASIVPHASQHSQADLAEHQPGPDWDYLDGDGMMVVHDDHCLFLPSGLHPKSLEQYVRSLLAFARDEHSASIPVGLERFELIRPANPEAVKQIRKERVKKIHLNVGQYMQAAIGDGKRETIVKNIGRNILSGLMEFVVDDADRRQIEEAANVNARLTISFDARRPGLTPEVLSTLAQGISDESEDDIEIETQSGKRVRAKSLCYAKLLASWCLQKLSTTRMLGRQWKRTSPNSRNRVAWTNEETALMAPHWARCLRARSLCRVPQPRSRSCSRSRPGSENFVYGPVHTGGHPARDHDDPGRPETPISRQLAGRQRPQART